MITHAAWLAFILSLVLGLDMLVTGCSSETWSTLALSGLALFPCIFVAGLAIHYHGLASRRGTWHW